MMTSTGPPPRLLAATRWRVYSIPSFRASPPLAAAELETAFLMKTNAREWSSFAVAPSATGCDKPAVINLLVCSPLACKYKLFIGITILPFLAISATCPLLFSAIEERVIGRSERSKCLDEIIWFIHTFAIAKLLTLGGNICNMHCTSTNHVLQVKFQNHKWYVGASSWSKEWKTWC